MESFIKNLARGAGKLLRSGFRKKQKITTKSAPYDLLTPYDLKSEHYIIDAISTRFPRHGIISEESRQALVKNKDLWIIDPIDGTAAFARGVAQFSVSIAYARADKLALAVVYDPINEEMFFAKTGRGAYLNGKKIHVSPRKQLTGSLALHSYNFPRTPLARIKHDLEVISKNQLLPWCLCSTALDGAYVACGRAEIHIDRDAHPWDYAACALILKEAGAKVTQVDGRPYRWNSTSLVAANPDLQRKLIKLLNVKR